MAIHMVQLEERPRSFTHYRREMETLPVAKHVIALLVELSHTTELTIGCYCADEEYCHRSALREILIAKGAGVRL